MGSMAALSYMYVLGCMCHPRISAEWSSHHSDISYNALNGPIPDSLGSLTNMNYLCARLPASPTVLSMLSFPAPPSRHHRYLGWNNVLNGTIPSSLGSLTELTFLCVRGYVSHALAQC